MCRLGLVGFFSLPSGKWFFSGHMDKYVFDIYLGLSKI